MVRQGRILLMSGQRASQDGTEGLVRRDRGPCKTGQRALQGGTEGLETLDHVRCDHSVQASKDTTEQRSIRRMHGAEQPGARRPFRFYHNRLVATINILLIAWTEAAECGGDATADDDEAVSIVVILGTEI